MAVTLSDAIENIVANQIMEWFNRKVKTTDISPLYAAIKKKDTVAIEEFIRSLLSKSISYFDSHESFYHGFFLSLLYGMPGYSSRSNHEEGDGRPDIVLLQDKARNPVYLFEIKIKKNITRWIWGFRKPLNR